MKSELLKFKIHNSKFKDSKWKIINITDDLTWLRDFQDIIKNYYWFTGYKDTANNEMFEGDIIKFTSNNINTMGHIEYRRDRNRNGFYVTTTGSIKYLLLNEFFIEGSKPLIIGNIVDHKNLIEKR